MKVFFKISFLVFYIFIVVGFQISSHYCGNYLVSVDLSISSNAEQENCCGDAEEETSCCSNKVLDIQIEDAQKYSQISFDFKVSPEKISFSGLFSDNKDFTVLINNSNQKSNSPPDIHLINCNWLI